MNVATTRIIAAVLDSAELKLYKEDGSTISVLQGDPRLQGFLDQAVPGINAQGYVDLDLTVPNTWAEYEEKSSGFVRFFRVAKSKLKDIFGANNPGRTPGAPVRPVSVGSVPVPVAPEQVQKAMNDQAAVTEIMKHTKPVAQDIYTGTNDLIRKDETLIAVVGKETPTVVPGVENLKRQVERANVSGSTQGVDSFMKRLAGVISTRRHSVEELMRFMQRGDLPVSVSGKVIIYKVLRKYGSEPGHYVDCHSGKVTQRIGSLVCMDEKLVDWDRNQECSNGLHVARRGYISGFSGDVCVVAVVRPEDVIAVPNHDANKMRVCAYHILFELSNTNYQLLRRNQPIDSTSRDAQLLARALEDGFPAYDQIVEIQGSMGTKLKITNLTEASSKELANTEAPIPETPALPLNVNADEKSNNADLSAPAVDPRKVSEQMNEEKPIAESATHPASDTPAGSDLPGGNGEPMKTVLPPTQSQQAQKLYEEFLDKSTDAKAQPNDVMASAKALLLFKQKTKKSWQKLGFTEDLTEILTKASKG